MSRIRTRGQGTLGGQVDALAKVLWEEFGGPVGSESACEMAVRVLRELREESLRTSEALRRHVSGGMDD